MNKFIFALSIIGFFGFSQEKIIGVVDYDFIINNPDGTTFANPYRMYFDLNTTYYTKVGSVKEIKDKSKIELDEKVVTKNIIKNDLQQPYYYTNINTNELIFGESIVNKFYIVKDSIESIPWRLHVEHKKVGNYSCQKAIATYRGREYTVWFTTETPVSHGPWKLRGLPGLIMEVAEETGKFEFRVTKINLQPNPTSVRDKLNKPNIEKITGVKTYIIALQNSYEELIAKTIASLPRGSKPLIDCDICPDPKNHNLERFDKR